jgi:hypothetical protein
MIRLRTIIMYLDVFKRVLYRRINDRIVNRHVHYGKNKWQGSPNKNIEGQVVVWNSDRK